MQTGLHQTGKHHPGSSDGGQRECLWEQSDLHFLQTETSFTVSFGTRLQKAKFRKRSTGFRIIYPRKWYPSDSVNHQFCVLFENLHYQPSPPPIVSASFSNSNANLKLLHFEIMLAQRQFAMSLYSLLKIN